MMFGKRGGKLSETSPVACLPESPLACWMPVEPPRPLPATIHERLEFFVEENNKSGVRIRPRNSRFRLIHTALRNNTAPAASPHVAENLK